MDLICFDLDNTLIHSDKCHVYAFNKALKKFGVKPKKYESIAKLFGRPKQEVIDKLAPNCDNKTKLKILKYHNIYLRNDYYKLARKIKYVLPVLKKLNKRYELAIVSNAYHKNIIALLKGAKLDRKYFKLIIGNDDVKDSKPYPDEILKAEKLLHHKAKYMIGDSIYDVMAGKKAKVKTISVLTGRYSKRKLDEYKPDYIIKDFRELFGILPIF